MCDEFLDAHRDGFESNEHKEELISKAQSFYAELGGEAETTFVDSVDEEELVYLRKLQIYARYGVYMDQLCDRLQITIQAEKEERCGTPARSTRWTRSAGNIVRHHMESWRPLPSEFVSQGPENNRELRVLEEAAGSIGLETAQILHALDRHTAITKVAHFDLEKAIKSGDWTQIATMLEDDLTDLPLVVDENHSQDREMLCVIITVLSMEYSDSRPEFPGPAMRVPSKTLQIKHVSLAEEIAYESALIHGELNTHFRELAEKRDRDYEILINWMVDECGPEGITLRTETRTPGLAPVTAPEIAGKAT